MMANALYEQTFYLPKSTNILNFKFIQNPVHISRVTQTTSMLKQNPELKLKNRSAIFWNINVFIHSFIYSFIYKCLYSYIQIHNEHFIPIVKQVNGNTKQK